MKISEIFHSIQGEGKLLGIPSTFIRLTGCNLRCIWCDTPYASWNPQGSEMSITEIMTEVMKWRPSHIVLTGGEPMLSKETTQLITELKKSNLHITLETAATLWLDDLPPIDLASISPKLSNAQTPNSINLPILQKFATDNRFTDRQWKFVISRQQDLAELEDLLTRLNISSHDVLLMPEGIDATILAERGRWLAETCKHHGYRFCPRLHVALYGNKRRT